jgi:CMP-N-acetylneuraminic acid synthetase
MNNKIIAVIPMRSGSTRLLNKNIKLLHGRPLGVYAIEAAIKADIFDTIIINSDSREYLGIMQLSINPELLYKKNLKSQKLLFYLRDDKLAQDNIQLEDVVIDCVEKLNLNPDIVATIQCTSPFILPEHLKGALNLMYNFKYNSLLSVCNPFKRFIWVKDHNRYVTCNYNPYNRPDMKTFNYSYIENGAFYFSKYELLKTLECRLTQDVGIYLMINKGCDIDIDTIDDFNNAEQIMRELN